jgi:hypothetical protein
VSPPAKPLPELLPGQKRRKMGDTKKKLVSPAKPLPELLPGQGDTSDTNFAIKRNEK